MKLAFFVGGAKMPLQLPCVHSQSTRMSAYGRFWFSATMIVSAGRTNCPRRVGGPGLFVLSSAGIQVAAQLFIPYEIGIRWLGSSSQPSELVPSFEGSVGASPGTTRLYGFEGQASTSRVFRYGWTAFFQT